MASEDLPQPTCNWQIERDTLLMYIHEHPGCKKREILRDLDLSEWRWDNRLRESIGFNNAVYQDQGWYTTRDFEVKELPQIRKRSWMTRLHEALLHLLDTVKSGDDGDILEAAHAYKELQRSAPFEYPLSVYTNEVTRFELLLEP